MATVEPSSALYASYGALCYLRCNPQRDAGRRCNDTDGSSNKSLSQGLRSVPGWEAGDRVGIVVSGWPRQGRLVAAERPSFPPPSRLSHLTEGTVWDWIVGINVGYHTSRSPGKEWSYIDAISDQSDPRPWMDGHDWALPSWQLTPIADDMSTAPSSTKGPSVTVAFTLRILSTQQSPQHHTASQRLHQRPGRDDEEGGSAANWASRCASQLQQKQQRRRESRMDVLLYR